MKTYPIKNGFLSYTKKYNFLFLSLHKYFCDFMAIAAVQIKRWGNSLGVIIPASTAKQLNLKEGKMAIIEIKAKERIDCFGICKGAKPFKEEEEPHKELWGMK